MNCKRRNYIKIKDAGKFYWFVQNIFWETKMPSGKMSIQKLLYALRSRNTELYKAYISRLTAAEIRFLRNTEEKTPGQRE